MKIPEYIILTPISSQKFYSFDRFIKNVISFQPKPKEMVFCAEPEIVCEIAKKEQILKKQGIKLVVLTIDPEVLNKYPIHGLIQRIKWSREYLRHYFIRSQFKWALWLDSDIIPEPNVAQALLEVAQSEKFLAVTNQCPGRDNHAWSGIGCTLTHKAACTLTRFEIGYVIWNGKEKHLSEDYCFLAILDAGRPFIKMWTGWNSRKIGRFVSVWHEIHPGVDKFLKKLKKDDPF